MAALHDDGPEVLAAHHGPGSAPGGEVAQVCRESRIAHAILPRGSALEDTNGLAVLGPQAFVDFPSCLAPQIGCREDLDLIVADAQVGGLGRAPFHDDPVPACELELRAPETAALGVQETPGQGRAGGHGVAALPRDRAAGGRGGGDDQPVVGTQGIDPGGHLPQQVVQGQGATADVAPVHLRGRLLDGTAAAGEVDAQDSPPVTEVLLFHGFGSPSYFSSVSGSQVASPGT